MFALYAVDLCSGVAPADFEFVHLAQRWAGVAEAGGQIHGAADLVVDADDFLAEIAGGVVGAGLCLGFAGEGAHEVGAAHVVGGAL
ncbi:hypothetical protein [Spectribacter hydrogenoxidans]|uniref:Uncharacterized protein n=1 Tax=Spectribacter hydrogenoxidans TaxID=3075608 RepID=A0ABU3C0G4_9GAMM|nr:hypothetical protein [Salinisphaera sp. W335]MDT0635058.1 hypothetical protein [Salinisphaera sp. W335]